MQQASSEQKAAEAKTKATNSVHMVAMCLGLPGHYRRGRVIVEIGNSVQKASAELEGCYKAGTNNFHIVHAQFGHSLVFRRLWARLASVPGLERMGFRFDDRRPEFYKNQVGGAAGAASSSGPDPWRGRLEFHADHLEQERFAKMVWSLVCGLVKHRGQSMSQFVDLPLVQMALLLGNPSQQSLGLKSLSDFWDALMAAEHRQSCTPGVSDLVGSLTRADRPNGGFEALGRCRNQMLLGPLLGPRCASAGGGVAAHRASVAGRRLGADAGGVLELVVAGEGDRALRMRRVLLRLEELGPCMPLVAKCCCRPQRAAVLRPLRDGGHKVPIEVSLASPALGIHPDPCFAADCDFSALGGRCVSAGRRVVAVR